MPSVTFLVKVDTKFGESVALIGSWCHWQPEKAIDLTTDKDKFPTWTARVELPSSLVNQEIEYKYVVRKKSGDVKWEPFKGNRTLLVADASREIDDGWFGRKEGATGSTPTNISGTPAGIPGGAQGRGTPAGSASPVTALLAGLSLSPSPGPPRATPSPSGEEGAELPLFIRTSDASSEAAFVDVLAQENAARKSWRQKLEFVRNCFVGDGKAAACFTPDLPHLAYIAIYLHFLSAGEVRCEEDGRHFRPNHLAENARAIDEKLARVGRALPAAQFVIRRIYPLLPSYAASFTCSVPLTRIRDIAHRNDIPQPLKLEIKHQLQNKLHRCAGPEDLVKAKEVLDRITAPGASYSGAFVHEYKIFWQELNEFFNARGVEERLEELRTRGEVDGEGTRLSHDFVWAKHDPQTPPLELLRRLTALRVHLTHVVNGAEAASEGLQRVRLAEIKLEEFAFPVLSGLVNALEARGERLPWAEACEALALCAANVALGGVEPEECRAIEAEARSFLPDPEAALARPGPEPLRLRASVERCRRLGEAHSARVLDIFMARVQALGARLGVQEHAVRVFCEGLVRSHVVFQLSKLASLLLRRLRAVLGLPPWDPLVAGTAVGRFVRAGSIEEVEREGGSDRLVVALARAEGDEEIPRRVAGVLLAHDLPHLSHLAVRARQEGVALAAVDDPDYLAKLLAPLGNSPGTVTLTVAADAAQSSIVRGAHAAHGAHAENGKHAAAAAPFKAPEVELASSVAALPLERATPARAGAKCDGARRLRELAAAAGGAGFRDPAGVCVPFGVMELCVKAAPGGLAKEYERLRGEAEKCSMEALPALAEKLRAMLRALPVPAALAREVAAAFKPEARLMVRSSANVEDLEGMSGAGLYDSLANVPCEGPALGKALAAVWSSLWTRRAAGARRQAGVPHAAAFMAVLVQEMVPADASFVLMTANPLTGAPGELYLELALGMGETLASGAARGSPYRFVVPSGGPLRTLALASFSHKLVPAPEPWRGAEGGAEADVGALARVLVDYAAERLSREAGFREAVAERVARAGRAIEAAHGGRPQDVEGALVFRGPRPEDADLYVVQTRPQIIRS